MRTSCKGGSATPPLGSLVLQIVKAQSGLDCKRRVRHSYRLRTTLNGFSKGRFCARYTKTSSRWKQNRIVQIDETTLLWYSGLVVKPEQLRTVTIEYLRTKKSRTVCKPTAMKNSIGSTVLVLIIAPTCCGFQVQDVCLKLSFIGLFKARPYLIAFFSSFRASYKLCKNCKVLT